jgi:ketosteroid isomerase-like protein
MSEQEKNIELVKDMFYAYDKGDIKTIVESLAEDKIDWKCPLTNDFSGMEFAKPRHNRHEVESFFKEFLGAIEPIEVKPLRYTAQEDRVIVEGIEHSKVKSTGIEYKVAFVMVVGLSKGKVTEFNYYADTADVRLALQGKVSKAA